MKQESGFLDGEEFYSFRGVFIRSRTYTDISVRFRTGESGTGRLASRGEGGVVHEGGK